MNVSIHSLSIQNRRPLTLVRAGWSSGNHQNYKETSGGVPLSGLKMNFLITTKYYKQYFDQLDLKTSKLSPENFIPINLTKLLREIYEKTTVAEKINGVQELEQKPRVYVFDFDNTLFPSQTKNKQELTEAIENFALLQEYCKLNNIILVLATGQTEAGLNKLLESHYITLSGVDAIADGTASRMSFRTVDNTWQMVGDYLTDIEFSASNINEIVKEIFRENFVDSLHEIMNNSDLCLAHQDGLHIYDKFTSFITKATKSEVDDMIQNIKGALNKENFQTTITTGIAAEGDNSLPPAERNYWFINIQPEGICGKVKAKKFILSLMEEKLPDDLRSQIQIVIAGDSANDFATMTNADNDLKQICVVVGNSSQPFKDSLIERSSNSTKDKQIRMIDDNQKNIVVFPSQELTLGIIEADEMLRKLE